jgi:N-acetylmuramic acid 6-phosphate etherase
MNEQDEAVPRAVRAELPRVQAAVERITRAFKQGGRLFFLGAGTSGRLGVLEATECPPTFNLEPSQVQAVIAGGEPALFHAFDLVEDDAAAGARDLVEHGFGAADVLVGISASGRSRYVLGAVEHARQAGGATVGISCNQDSPLARAVEIPITPVTGPEVVAGSTRLKAATATKLVLNMLTTATMIRLGHVFDNLMVNVQPTNFKLRERARRIIRQLTGVDETRSAELLEASGNCVKTAIVMGRLNVSREEAERRLAACEGHLSQAM